jgi:N-acetylglucosaminyldiphosphoundecaprenol N-acetyl-beta-D-mannosaminyltransferase
MIDRGKRSVLGIGIDVVDYDGAVERIVSAARARQPLGVSALAVHGVMTGVLDPEQGYRLGRLHLVTPDGQPVRWALHLLHGEKLADRVYGPTLAARVCRRADELGLSIYLYGSRQSVIDTWRAKLANELPALRIAGAEPSQFRRLTEEESHELDERITTSGADIVLVGLGCPRQETFVYEHVDTVSRPMLAIGAAFDFNAGLLKQAPAWMQNAGLEWIFRLWTEPRRLWRRYLYLNPMFVGLIIAQIAGWDGVKGQPPVTPLHYG